jgi:predicted PurR-regulated permease PerM
MDRPPPARTVNFNFQFTTSQIIRLTIIVIAVLLGVYFLQQLLPVLFLLLIAVMLATAIEPLVNRLRRGIFNRAAGILVVYTGLFLIIAALAWLTIPVIVAQVSEVGRQMPNISRDIHTMAQQSGNSFAKSQLDTIGNAIDQVFVAPPPPSTNPDETAQQVQQTTTTVLSVAEGVFSVLAIFVIAFYWLTERTLIKRWFLSLLPADRGNRVRRVWDDIEVKVGGWVRGQLTLMLLVGAVSAVGYFTIGLKYWPVLAVIIFICEAIPLVGPYIGTAPAVLVAFTQTGNEGLPGLLGMGDFGPVPRALAVIVFAILLQAVEGNVLVPRVMRNSVGISPLTVMVSLLVGATLGGLAGALLAVPMAGALQVIVADMRAAAVSDAALTDQTAAAEATRAAEGELVVAHSGTDGHPTSTEVVGPGS